MCKIDGAVCTVSYLPKHKLKCIDFVPTCVVKKLTRKSAGNISRKRLADIYTRTYKDRKRKKEKIRDLKG